MTALSEDQESASEDQESADTAATLQWPQIDAAVLGLPDLAVIDDEEAVSINELVASFEQAAHGTSFLAWRSYQVAAELHTRLVEPTMDDDTDWIDQRAQCAMRIAASLAISQLTAESLLGEAIALRDRLPLVSACLCDGVLTKAQTVAIIGRTDLVGGEHIGEVDAAITKELRKRRGRWSPQAIRDLADRIVFRHDPEAVRERRKHAKGQRAVWVEDLGDGMATLAASMTAENARIAVAAVQALAGTVCSKDGRGKRARNSDAAFALLSGTRFECQCGRAECDAEIPEPGTLPPAQARIVLHVVCEETTLTDPDNTTPAHMNGYGVISAEHARELAQRPDAVIKPINPQPAPAQPTPTPPGDLSDDATTPLPEVRGAQATSLEGPGETASDTTPPVCDVPEAASVDDGIPPLPEVRGALAAGLSKDRASLRAGTASKSQGLEGPGEKPSKPATDKPVNCEKPTRGNPDFWRRIPEPEPTPLPPSAILPGLAPHLPSDPYRPSTALITYILSREGTCSVPGCTKPAWECELDHVSEYNHDDPYAGGHTDPAGIGAKCRFHHLAKTLTDFIDDQVLDEHGRPHTTWITPEGLVLPGRADSIIDIVPALGRIRWQPADTRTRPRVIFDGTGELPKKRRRPRTVDKHLRRQRERLRNRLRIEAEPPPPF
uniref:HNH endonuclease signature motif containing protein n=1 Tax=Gordonia sp. B7-2 TaxID=3420932 RepID=UPI003D9200A2